MKVKVKAFKFVNEKPDKTPYKEFGLSIDAPYVQYGESEKFLDQICCASAQWLGTEGLSVSPTWTARQEKECEVIVNFVDAGGVQTDPVTIRANAITSSRKSMKKREVRLLLRVSWE